MLDMADWTLVTPTLQLRDELAAAGVPVAQTLQAYLRRTAADLEPIIATGGAVRLVKGAFADRTERAFARRTAIGQLSGAGGSHAVDDARKADFYPIFGTHDERLAIRILALAETRGWPRDSFEFEMLYGAHPRLQRLMADGARLRLYLPFGEAWFRMPSGASARARSTSAYPAGAAS